MPDCQFRVADHHRRQHLGVKDDLLHMGFGIGDDAGAAHLRPGARGRRHGNDRRNGVRVRACPPVADILKVPKRPRLARHEGDHLAQVQTGPAAKGDHRRHDRHRGSTFRPASRLISLGLGSTSANMARPRPAASIRSRVCAVIGKSRKPAVGYQQRFADTGLRTGLADFGNAACSKTDSGRIRPVSSQVHDVTFLR